MKTFAYAWASGLIQFGKSVPEGALPIISGQEDDVKNILIAISRHSRTNDDLLVPGVPEAANQHLALDAFMKFSDWARRDYAQLMKKWPAVPMRNIPSRSSVASLAAPMLPDTRVNRPATPPAQKALSIGWPVRFLAPCSG